MGSLRLAWVAFVVVFGGACSVHALPITFTPAKLWDAFPRSTQGDCGIYLQARAIGTGNYEDLTYWSDYWFTTPTDYWLIPYAGTKESPLIATHPSIDCDVVMKVLLEGGPGLVHVTGVATQPSWGDVYFSIYKGASSWATHLWDGVPGSYGSDNPSFDLTISYQPGEALFFAVSSGAEADHDWAEWQDTELTGVAVPEPATLGLMSIGALGLRQLLRRRRSAATE